MANWVRQAAVGIVNNTAYIQGGGLVADSTALSARGAQYQYHMSDVEGNAGGLSGGALILTGGDIAISGDSVFRASLVGAKGGAILTQGIDEWTLPLTTLSLSTTRPSTETHS